MNRTKLLTIAVIGLLILNLGTLFMLLLNGPSRGPRPDGPPHGREGRPREVIIRRLNFDAAQQEQYDLIIEEHQSGTRELNDKSRELRNRLYSLLKNDSVPAAEKNEILTAITANQEAIDELNFDHFRKIRQICRKDQLDEFEQLAEDLSGLFGPKGPPPRD